MSPKPPTRTHRAFTLIELLASMAILVVMIGMLFAVFQQTSKAWLAGENRVDTFAQARAALALMSRELSQAIVTNTISFFGEEDETLLGAPPAPKQIPLYMDNVAFVAPVGDGATDGMDLMEVVYRLSRVLPNNKPESIMGLAYKPFFFTNNVPGPFRLIRRTSAFSSAAADCRNYGTFGPPPNVVPWDFYGLPNPNPDWPETSDSQRTAVLADNVMSLQFQFQDVKGNWTVDKVKKRPFWNSTNAAGWNQELGDPGSPRPVPPATSVQPPADSADMLDHAPALVLITLTLVDSKAAARFSAATDPDAKKRIYLESMREFTTSVAIPNGKP
jgi:prepilin-type N-terminal cleavage/methylation domain-containing protein